MLKFKKYKVLLFLASVFLTFGCNKKDIDGREVHPASADFKVTENLVLSDGSPDFTAGTMSLTAKFSEEVTCLVTLKGLESGAEKTFSLLKTSVLDAQNTKWNGTHDGLYFFRKGEKVAVDMSFFGSDLVQKDTLIIDEVQTFTNATHFPLNNAGFEVEPIAYPWVVYGTPMFGVVSDEIVQVQGKNAFRMGADATKTGYQGGMDSEVWNYSGTPLAPLDTTFFPFSSNPDELYFNIYLYGRGVAADKMIIEFKEADGAHKKNLNGRDDGVQIIQTMGHEGWKLFSYQYSALPFSTYAPGGGSGNKVREPHKIFRVAFSLEITETAPRYGDAIFDFPIFTIGKPFNPSKF